MRLWIFNREFPPTGDQHNTGVIKAVHGLAAGLADAGLEITVLCENAADSVYESPGGYTVRCFANEKYNRAFSRLSCGLRQFIAAADYPVVALLNGIFNPSVYRMSRELRKANIPYVVAPHDPYHPEIFSRRRIVKTVYWHLFESKLLRQARCVQVLDQRHEHWLRRLDIHTPAIECQNGFFLEDLASIPEPRWDEDATTKLLFLGRLDTHNKGLDLLIEAFKGVADAHENVHLTLQGPDWGDRARVLAMIDAGSLQKRVTVKDADYNTRSPVIIARHDIFCLPSRFEGFGLSALEAMLAGRVLLVTDIAGIAPHVRSSDCGVVVDPSAASVKSGILKLLERRSQWREMGLRGREYAIEHLRWDRIAAKVAAEYRQMLPTLSAEQPAVAPAQRVGKAFKEVEKVSLPGQLGS